MSRSLLRLYPASYRASCGQEILDVHRELTTDLPRAARLRADADLVAHALRVRLGLDSASPGGQFAALAAPFALAVALAYSGIQLMTWYAGMALSPGPTWRHVANTSGLNALNLLLLATVCAGAFVALAWRWLPGAVLAVSGLLGLTAQWTVVPGRFDDGPFEPVAAALTVAVILACPPDGRDDRRLSAMAGALAAVAWFPVALVKTRDFIVSTDYGVWPLVAVIVTGAVLVLRNRSSGVRELGAMAAASPLFLAHAYANGWLDLPPAAGIALALAMPALACVAACIRISISDEPRSP